MVSRLEDIMMFKKLIFSLLFSLLFVANGNMVANAAEESSMEVYSEVVEEETTQRDPFGDYDVSKPGLGDMFRFNQNTIVSLMSGEEIEITPNDTCYLTSGPDGRGQWRIYIEGMDPSTKVYVRFWTDTNFTVIQENALIAGDLNADTHVDAFDLVIARRLLIESINGDAIDALSLIRGDMNKDECFNVADLVALQRFLLGYTVSDSDESTESDYTAIKSISPHGFAGSSAYTVSLFSNGDLTINSKLYAVDVIDIGSEADGQIIIQGGTVLGESQKGWITQSDEAPPISQVASTGTTLKPTGFSGASQHFVCLTGQNQVYIDGEFYADGVEQIYVETDKENQYFGAVFCFGGDWYQDSPSWVIVE